MIHAGTYRETVTVAADGTAERPIRFEAAPGERVVITGADEVREWRKEPGAGEVYSAPWPHRFIGWNASGTHPDDDEHRMIGRCEQVFVRGYSLLQVLERGQLGRGTFFVDLDAKRLYACPRDGSDLSKGETLVEASARALIWHSRGANVQVRGVRFRYAANMAQHGATLFEGARGVVEDCTFEATNSVGASFAAEGLVVRRCTFRDNGQLGFGASRAHGLLFSDNTVSHNNIKGFSRGWEAGGDKLVLCRGAVLERSRFVENRGCGVWFDIGNEACVVRNCLIADNEDAGIFYEISSGLNAHDNVIVGNGFAATPGAWGAGAGIVLSSSPGGRIERNLLIGNREGFNFREQGRTTPTIDDPAERPTWNHDETIRGNVIAWNRDAQVGGWFDVANHRHWPAALQREFAEKEGKPAGHADAVGTPSKPLAEASAGQSLKDLRIAFEGNLYEARPWEALFRWGVPWRMNETYATPEAVAMRLGIEQGSRAAALRFGNAAALDYRVPADSPALQMGCYPRGEVPGVLLGVLPASPGGTGAAAP